MQIINVAGKIDAMHAIYAVDEYNFNDKIETIFLAGPTPRSSKVKSWRPKALELLAEHGYDGDVFIPEAENGKWEQTYQEQIEWEHKLLDGCTAILMWVPRDIETMPAFTTNVEFGMYLEYDKLQYGRPDDAPKNKYLDYCFEKSLNRKPEKTLEKLVIQTLQYINSE